MRAFSVDKTACRSHMRASMQHVSSCCWSRQVPAPGACRRACRYIKIYAKSASDNSRSLALRIAPVIAAVVLSSSSAVQAAEFASVGTCLLRNCQSELAQCLGDANCLKNIVCLNSCNGRPDETACQIRCGDLYEDQSVDIFNSCAVSAKKCVPERVTDGLYPVPPDCAVNQGPDQFRPADFQGRWFITAGYNDLFDLFDCQVHYFASPDPEKLLAKINWRIPKPDGDFIERSTMQSFIQEPNKPGVLLNHGNEYLHYEDDWYIVKSKKDSYFFVYYKGNNDAWKGYGGAVVYTRAPSLPQELIPDLKDAAASVGLEWDRFQVTNNTCAPHPPPRTLGQELREDVNIIERNIEDDVKVFERNFEDDVKGLERNIEGDVKVLEQKFESSLKSFGRGFTVLESNVLRELTDEEKLLAEEIKQAETKFQSLEKEFAREFGLAPSTEANLVKPEAWLWLTGLLAVLLPLGAKQRSKADPKPPKETKSPDKEASSRTKQKTFAKKK